VGRIGEKAMRYVEKRKVVIIFPENATDKERIRAKIASFVDVGYRIERRKWGGYVLFDPSMRFTWEIKEVLFDAKKIIGEP